jgi:hypothetical protein
VLAFYPKSFFKHSFPLLVLQAVSASLPRRDETSDIAGLPSHIISWNSYQPHSLGGAAIDLIDKKSPFQRLTLIFQLFTRRSWKISNAKFMHDYTSIEFYFSVTSSSALVG